MVILETIVTGFVDKFPILGLNAKIRFSTTVSVAIVLFLSGIAMTTQVLSQSCSFVQKRNSKTKGSS